MPGGTLGITIPRCPTIANNSPARLLYVETGDIMPDATGMSSKSSSLSSLVQVPNQLFVSACSLFDLPCFRFHKPGL